MSTSHSIPRRKILIAVAGAAAAATAGCTVTSGGRSSDREAPPPSTPPGAAPPNLAEAEPPAWFRAGSRPSEYAWTSEADPDDESRHVRTLRFSAPGSPTGFGTGMQMFSAERYRGRRVRFSGTVQANGVTGWAGLWMRVDGPRKEQLAFDNMGSRAIRGTTSKTRYDVVLDVAPTAHAIALGILLHGEGVVVLTKPTFEIVDTTVATTSSGFRLASLFAP